MMAAANALPFAYLAGPHPRQRANSSPITGVEFKMADRLFTVPRDHFRGRPAPETRT
jgi:hypothetical protein